MGLSGLFALATASTWITAAGSRTVTALRDKLATETVALKKTIAKQQAELDDARKSTPTRAPPATEFEPQPPSADVKQLEGALPSLSVRHKLATARQSSQRFVPPRPSRI